MHKDSTRVMSNEDISMQMHHSRWRAWSETEKVWLVKIYAEEKPKKQKKRVWKRISELFKECFEYERSEEQLMHQFRICKNNFLVKNRRQWFTPDQNNFLLSLRKEHGRDREKILSNFRAKFPDVTLTMNTITTRLNYLLKRKSSSDKQLDRSRQPIHQSLPHPSTADESILENSTPENSTPDQSTPDQSTPDQSTPDQSIVDQWPVAETADSYTVTENSGNDAGADLFEQLLGLT
jgi:hypothetical protein